MHQQPLDQQKKMGPKVIQKEKDGFCMKHAEGDCEPDDEDEEQEIVQRIRVSYVSNEKPRFDSAGRAIKKGGEYCIQFIPYITVCLFEPQENPQQIRKQLEEYQTNSPPKLNYQSQMTSKNSTQIILISNLKKK